jgi:hypothetical protein
MAVAQHDARHRLHLKIVHRFALLLRKVSHLRLGKLYVIKVAFGDLRYGSLDFLRYETKVFWRPFVELLG